VQNIQRLTIIAALGLAAGCSVGGGGDGGFGSGAEGPGQTTDSEGATEGGTAGDTEGGTAGTAGEPADGDGGNGQEYVDEAREKYPTYFDLHEGVITRTCTPFDNVCHNNKEYPDLRTPQAMLGHVGNPCNLAEEEAVYNGCEPDGDHVTFTAGNNAGFETEVAYVAFNDDGLGNIASVTLFLRDNIPQGMAVPAMGESVDFSRVTATGLLPAGSVTDAVTYAGGTNSLTINNFPALDGATQTLLEAELVVGDPNKDGIFGATEEEAMQEIKRGDPWNSYLLQRLQGNVPGSPMPLANTPLSAAEIVAVACWIEGTDAEGGDLPDAVINYDDCQYAAEFGVPDPDSGATLSGHVQPILDTRCAAAGCHGEVAPAAGLDLTAGKSRDNLLLIASTQNPDLSLVTPGNPTNSYLMTKLTGAGFTGQQMPLAAQQLSDAELEIVRLWISYGAPND
jgi:hypothetical protein